MHVTKEDINKYAIPRNFVNRSKETMKTEDLIIKTDTQIIEDANKAIAKIMNVEYHLRKKVKRLHKHIKNMERGMKWRNEVIVELAFRLGMNEEEVVALSEKDYSILADAVSNPPEPNKELTELFDKCRGKDKC